MLCPSLYGRPNGLGTSGRFGYLDTLPADWCTVHEGFTFHHGVESPGANFGSPGDYIKGVASTIIARGCRMDPLCVGFQRTAAGAQWKSAIRPKDEWMPLASRGACDGLFVKTSTSECTGREFLVARRTQTPTCHVCNTHIHHQLTLQPQRAQPPHAAQASTAQLSAHAQSAVQLATAAAPRAPVSQSARAANRAGAGTPAPSKASMPG